MILFIYSLEIYCFRTVLFLQSRLLMAEQNCTKTLGYDRPAFLVVHPFLNLGLVNHIFFLGGGSNGGGSNIETYGENYTLYCKWL